MLISVVESDISTADQNRVNQWIRKEIYTLSSTGMYNRSSKVLSPTKYDIVFLPSSERIIRVKAQLVVWIRR